jgi:beta-glucosidase
MIEGRPGMMTGTSYTTNYIQHDPNPPAEEDYMGNIIQSFDDPNGQHLGPTCAVSWIEVGKCLLGLPMPVVPLTSLSVPWGLRKILNFVWNRYHVPIYITENGVPVAGEAQMSLPSLLDDQARVDYICSYLDAMKAAVIDDGVDVRSYFAWTLTDNWEWADGFTTRFGVTFVERDEKGRVVRYWPKKSASAVTKWFAENASTKNRKIEHTAP